jgi:outer membrane protein assembly factor BamA
MRMRARVAIFIILLASQLAAQDDSLQTGLDWSFVPIPAYTPETSWLAALTAFVTYRDTADASYSPSSLAIAAQGTLKKQFAIGLYPEIYLDNNRMRIEGAIEWHLYPYNFFGIGNNNPSEHAELYTPHGAKLELRALYALSGTRVQHGLSAGVHLDVRYDHIRSVEPRTDGTQGPLGRGEVVGSRGGWFNGIGPQVSYDTRDNNFDARAGVFAETHVVAYGALLGSNFSSVVATLDARAYALLFSDVSVAGRVLILSSTGTPPFLQMPSIGGSNNMRGIIDAQQRDRISLLSGAEVRFPILWRFRGAVFADAGQVASQVTHIGIDQLWVSYGAGLRFLLVPEERISLRLDVGIARGIPQFYLGFNEAF